MSTIKDHEIDEFTRKATDVQAAIRALMEGTIDPQDIKIDGIETEQEMMKREELERIRAEAQKKKAADLRVSRKAEERERWWSAADMFARSEVQGSNESEEAADARAQRLLRYTSDYSRWNEWTPADPASIAEESEAKAKEDKIKNEQFEKSNPDFCSQFLEDMQTREKVTKKKQDSAEVARLKGNRSFKKKEFEEALGFYMEALKVLPYDAKTLTNIAQVYIKQRNWDEAFEFLQRTLRLEPHHIKALSRKALVLCELAQPDEALKCVAKALRLEPTNVDLRAQEADLRIVLREVADEERVRGFPADGLECPAVSVSTAGSATVCGYGQETSGQSNRNPPINIKGGGPSKANSVSATSAVSPPSLENPDPLVVLRQQVDAASAEVLAALVECVTTVKTKIAGGVTASDDEAGEPTVAWTKRGLASLVSACAEAMRLEALLRVYLRTSGELERCVTSLVGLLREALLLFPSPSSSPSSSSALGSSPAPAFPIPPKVALVAGRVLLFLAEAVKNERSSQLLLCDCGLLDACKRLVHATNLACLSGAARATIPGLVLLRGIAELLGVCAREQVCARAKAAVVADASLLERVGVILTQLTSIGHVRIAAGAGSASVGGGVADTVAAFASCIKSAAFYEPPANTSTLKAGMGPLVVSLAAALSVILRVKAAQSKGKLSSSLFSSEDAAESDSALCPALSLFEVAELLLEALLGLSQVESARGRFADLLPNHEESPSPPLVPSARGQKKSAVAGAVPPATPVAAVIELILECPDQKVNCLAVLMNLCLGAEEAGRREVLRCGGLGLALAGLSSASSSALGVEERAARWRAMSGDSACLSRSAGLLSRLASLEEAQAQLREPETYRVLCRELSNCRSGASAPSSKPSAAGGSGAEGAEEAEAGKWRAEQRSHLIRALAAVAPSAACRAVALEEGLVASVLAAFPQPRRELGEVTPSSVILPPLEVTSGVAGAAGMALLLGNAARCLLPYADDAPHATILFGGQGEGLLGVEKLVCAMATCSDMRVRRNIAILLAKGCRLPGVREKVQHFRGLQMIVELQDKL